MAHPNSNANSKLSAEELKGNTIYHDFLGKGCAPDFSPAASSSVRPPFLEPYPVASCASLGVFSGGGCGPVSTASDMCSAVCNDPTPLKYGLDRWLISNVFPPPVLLITWSFGSDFYTWAYDTGMGLVWARSVTIGIGAIPIFLVPTLGVVAYAVVAWTLGVPTVTNIAVTNGDVGSSKLGVL